ncbi:MAG TPA: DUF2889 domain-containing protein [Candidatus Methylomirabilis sp.]|nr:DUF2889 domain-containing protein [Candidatus Methylomirabilis sp.]
MITSPFLVGRDRYERVLDGWVDAMHEDAFTHTVTITDDDHSIELRVVCTPPPGYEVREARASIMAGPADPGIADRLSRLRGQRMVAGFTRRLADLCGPGTGSALFVDAGIEVARLARQVARLPSDAMAEWEPGHALKSWHLDTTGWTDLPNSCFTYSAAGRALLGTRPVFTPMVAELYQAPVGSQRIFVRKRHSRLVLTAGRLHLFHSMHDNVHGFDVHYEVDLAGGKIMAADSITSRLPYQGICTEPQARIADMVGQPADALLRRKIQTVLGGEGGCAQLYDVTADLLKLLEFA